MTGKKESRKGVSPNLFADLIHRRDEERRRIVKATKVVDGVSVPLENNPMGLYRWYLHPALENVALRNALFWIQELPPGSRSGKEKAQGGRVHYILEGRGHTIVDGIRYDWEKGDIIMIPMKPNGTEHQHFNDDPKNDARLIAIEPNWYDALGVDMGCGLEILEPAPEYRPA